VSTSAPQLLNYVGGEFLATDQTFPNISPIDGRLLSQVCEADEALVAHLDPDERRALTELLRTLLNRLGKTEASRPTPHQHSGPH